MKTKSKKVNRTWLHEHVNDPYVKLAQVDGYRARAAYKLKEIDESFKIFKPNQLVIDLGAAPGAWSQYIRRKILSFSRSSVVKDVLPSASSAGKENSRESSVRILALDVLDFEPIDGVQFIQGDFREEAVLQQLCAAMQGSQADVIVSDMAPNLSGIESSDAARISHLVELAVDFSMHYMQPSGVLVCKVFHGGGYDALRKLFQTCFRNVKVLKPKASRDKSSETFLIGIHLKQ